MNLFNIKTFVFTLSLAMVCVDISLADSFCSSHSTEQNVADVTYAETIFACPRCRRSQPKGPRKRPTPNAAKTTHTLCHGFINAPTQGFNQV